MEENPKDMKTKENGSSDAAVFILVALICGGCSLLIALIGITHYTEISTGGMLALALMVAAPVFMGIGICHVYSRLKK